MSDINNYYKEKGASMVEGTDVEVVIHDTEQNEVLIESTEVAKSLGVARIEIIKNYMDKNIISYIVFWSSLFICNFFYTVDSSTTYSYQVYATSSFHRHTMIATLGIATSIISAICKPFLAKISDITSRPIVFMLIMFFYVVGYIIVACSPTISAYVIGCVFASIGSSGLNLMVTILIGDLTPLKYRGLWQGIMSSPYIVTVWFTGYIVNDIVTTNWRWGYGMFVIIMPVVIFPAIFVLAFFDRRAHKDISKAKDESKKDWILLIKNSLIEIDAFGLILLGFGFSLLLLPFSLNTYAKGGWKNPSMIAMMIVGGILLIIFAIYEVKWCPMPCMPARVLNRTFITAVIIDVMYELAGYIGLEYLSSYTYIVKDWSIVHWNYWSNAMSISLCLFGVIAGALFSVTHRYKILQIFGLCVKLIGMALVIKPDRSTPNTAELVFYQILIGIGGGFSVVATQVSSQASVPHQDMALVISLLSLWSNIAASIGQAIAVAIWAAKMPTYLRQYLPASVSDAQVLEFFEDITTIRDYPMDSAIRQGAIKAYNHVNYYLFVPSMTLCFIPIIAACFQSNYYLGDEQNAVESMKKQERLKKEDHTRTLRQKCKELLF